MIEEKATKVGKFNKVEKPPRRHLHELLNWKVVLITSLILLGLFGVGLKFDYQVSDIFYKKSGAYIPAVIIYSYMVLFFVVLAFGISWAFVISCFSFKKDKIWISILGTIFGFGCMFGFGIYIYFLLHPFQLIYGEKNGQIHNIVLLVVVLIGSFIYTMAVFGDKLNKDMCKRTFTYLLEVVIVVGIIVLLKCIWSRPTPWNVFKPNEHTYLPWWHARPFYCLKETTMLDIFFWSTPAGYVSQGAVVIFATTSTLELTHRYNTRKLHALFFYSGFSYAIVLSIIRLLAGESFLTDVSLSLCCGLWMSFGSKKLAIIARKKFYGHHA